jgi:hypothetical protein
MRPSPYLPESKPFPEVSDASISTVRTLNNLAKALPSMPDGGSGSNARAEEAATFLYEMGISYAESKAREARGRAISRLKNKASDRMAKNFGLA